MSFKKTIAVDLDGVIFEYREWKGVEHFGKPIKNAVRSLELLKKMGFKIVIYTTRLNPKINTEEPLPVLKELVSAALKKERIPFDEIETSGKPMALYYIDDRGIRFSTWEIVLQQVAILEKHRANQFEKKK